jgi:hypothetical protein
MCDHSALREEGVRKEMPLTYDLMACGHRRLSAFVHSSRPELLPVLLPKDGA